MFLYDKKGDYIDVYRLEPKLEQIIEYRKKEMKKIPENERFSGCGSRDTKEQILQCYYEDVLFGYVLCSIPKDLGYTYSLYDRDDLRVGAGGNYVRDVIIHIPETLYLLEVLLQGRTYLIGESDIHSQLSLFNIEYVDTIACNLLKNMCDYNLIGESYDSIMDKMETNESVMKRVRKLAGK